MSNQASSVAFDRGWIHLIAAVCWLVGVVMVFSVFTIKTKLPRYSSIIPSERAAFMTAHDCEEHVRLAHTVSGENDSAWIEVEAQRNQEHRHLCEKLKQKAAAIKVPRHVKHAGNG